MADDARSDLPARPDEVEHTETLQVSPPQFDDRQYGSSSRVGPQQSQLPVPPPDANTVNQGLELLEIEEKRRIEEPAADKTGLDPQAVEDVTSNSQSTQLEPPQKETQSSASTRYEAELARIKRLDSKKFLSMGDQLRKDTDKIIEYLSSLGQPRTLIFDKYKELEERCHDAFAAFGDADVHPSNPLAASVADLRGVLDICLAENAIPEDVEFHLPRVRQIAEKLTTDYDMFFGPYINTLDIPKDESGHDDVVGAGPPVDPMDEQAFDSFGPKVSTGRHVPLVKGNDQSRPRPRPPHVFSESDSNQSRQT